MVQDSRTALRAHRLRPLATPRGLRVETDERDSPVSVQFEGAMCAVAAVQERWRIDDEWWREAPVSRMYYRLQLDGGRMLTVYRDLVGGAWCEQQY